MLKDQLEILFAISVSVVCMLAYSIEVYASQWIEHN